MRFNKIDTKKGIEKFFQEVEDFMCRVNRKFKEREKEIEERYARGARRTKGPIKLPL